MNFVTRALSRLQRRIYLTVARGVIELVDESKKMQTVQVSAAADVLRDSVERFQQYGFSAVPKNGAEAIVLHVRGSADHPVVIAVDDRRYRPKTLSEGESCMYTLQNGVRVLCKANGEVHIGSSPSDFVALAQKVLDELTKIKNAFNGHTHTVALGACSAGGNTGTATTSGGPSYNPASVAASEVKAK